MNRTEKAVCPACCHWPSRGCHGLEWSLTALWSLWSDLALRWVQVRRVWEADLLSCMGASSQSCLRAGFIEVQRTVKARSETQTLSGGRGSHLSWSLELWLWQLQLKASTSCKLKGFGMYEYAYTHDINVWGVSVTFYGQNEKRD